MISCYYVIMIMLSCWRDNVLPFFYLKTSHTATEIYRIRSANVDLGKSTFFGMKIRPRVGGRSWSPSYPRIWCVQPEISPFYPLHLSATPKILQVMYFAFCVTKFCESSWWQHGLKGCCRLDLARSFTLQMHGSWLSLPRGFQFTHFLWNLGSSLQIAF
jgi:hypothetical protein